MRRQSGACLGRRAKAALVLLLVLATSGCGPSVATVTGHVRYQGKSLTTGSVTFYGPEDRQIVTAFINADGSYTANKVPLGTVRVTVSTPPPMSEAQQKAIQKLNRGSFTPPPANLVSVPPKYGKPDQSGLELTVAKGSQPYEIELK